MTFTYAMHPVKYTDSGTKIIDTLQVAPYGGRMPRYQSLPMGVPRSQANAFARWLDTKQMTVPQFRQLLSKSGVVVSRATVYSWRNGNGAPKRTTAVLIEQLTKGAVTVAGW
jgi:hypothetical protein